jgi:hypothetical protein
MATDRRPILPVLADKVRVREYVKDRVGSEVLTHLYAVADSPERVRNFDFPREFVLKASHACGGVVLVAECFPPERQLPEPPAGWPRGLTIHPDALDWTRLTGLCAEWLSSRYNPYEEWAYSKVHPRILVEEFLSDDGVPVDYKFFVFGGQVHLVQVDQDRFGDHRRNLYSPDWKLLEVEYGYPRGPLDSKPARLDEMIRVAERLGGDLDFVRADLYNIGDRVVFGEMTIYPLSGCGRFSPREFDEQLGRLWQMPRRRRSMALHR